MTLFRKLLLASAAVLTMCLYCQDGFSQDQANASLLPLPDRNPLRLDDSPAHPRDVQAPEWNAQEIQQALDNCSMMLDGLDVEFQPIDPIREGQCGTPAPIKLSRVGTAIPVIIDPPARVTCGIAASMGAWVDTVLQPAAQATFGEPVTKIRNVASYVCRNRYNAPGKRISEHARANALDMAAFTTRSGRVVTVLEDWDKAVLPTGETSYLTASGPEGQKPKENAEQNKSPGDSSSTVQGSSPTTTASAEEPVPATTPAPEALFLRQIHQGGCKLFGTVLGPEANEAHRDHFHFDLAERRHSNFCE